MPPEPIIRLNNVHKTLGQQQVLRGITLAIPKGKMTTIIGRSGEGKSVLLKHMIGLLQPDRGEVWVDGVNIARLPPKPLNEVRKRFAMLFQGAALFGAPQHHVLDLASQGEVLVGDPAGRMGLELDPQLAPGYFQVGVVPGRLAQVADSVDGHQRHRPAVGVVLAPQPAVFQVPAGQAQLRQAGLDLGVGIDSGLIAHG